MTGILCTLILLILTLHSCHGVLRTTITTRASGKVDLVCTIDNLADDYWIAIYRTNLAYAECLFWDLATVKRAPYSCTGNFTVSISEVVTGTWEYAITLDRESSVVNARDYFCRTLRKESNDTYELVEQSIEQLPLDTRQFPVCLSSPQNQTFVDGDKFVLTCSPLGIIPVMIEWSRSDGIPIVGYADTFDLNKDDKDAEVQKGYILFHTELPITLDRTHDGVTFTCTVTSNTELNPQNDSQEMSICSMGPFTWRNRTSVGEDDSEDGPVLILGLDLWFFSFIVAASVVGVSILFNIILTITLIKRIRYEKYHVRRKQSQQPIVKNEHEMAHVENNTAQGNTRYYDSVDNGPDAPYVNDNGLEVPYANGDDFDGDFDGDFDDGYTNGPVYDNQ